MDQMVDDVGRRKIFRHIARRGYRNLSTPNITSIMARYKIDLDEFHLVKGTNGTIILSTIYCITIYLIKKKYV